MLYFFLTEFLPDILALDSSFLATYIVESEVSEEDVERSTNRKVSGEDCVSIAIN